MVQTRRFIPHGFKNKVGQIAPSAVTPLTAVIVHLGGNYMVALGIKDLYELMLSETAWLAKIFPGAKTGWSHIIPRYQWRGGELVKAINESAKHMNKKVAHLLITSTLSTIPHRCIKGETFFSQGRCSSDTRRKCHARG